MSIIYTKKGVSKKLNIPANDITVTDADNNFESSDLEHVLQELGESDSVYVSDSEPDKDGLWIDTTDIVADENVADENLIAKQIKKYINDSVITKYDKAIKDLESTDEVLKDEISKISNPNLLINSYFINPINQRDSTIYNEWGKYTIDRWINRTKSVAVQPDGLLITMDAQYGNVAQIFEDISIFKNKTVTLSGELEVIEGSVYSDLNSTDSNSNGHINCFKDFGVGNHSFSVTSTLSNDISELKLAIVNRIEGVSKVKLKWLKLELGSIATPFVPRLYGEELPLCQRYYQNKFVGKAVLQNVPHKLDVVAGFCSLSVPMRTKPTVKLKPNTDLTKGVFGQWLHAIPFTSFVYYPDQSSNHGIHFGFISSTPINQSGLLFGLANEMLEADSELY